MKLATELIGHELKLFEQYLDEEFQSSIQSADKVMKYLTSTKGKQLRPMFVLLCARLGGEINRTAYRAAALVEILHTASLVHDDIVDNSMKRRKAFSVNALWKSRMAVFAGDILFTKGVLLSLDNKDHDILKIFSKAIEQTVAGELVQLQKSKKLNLDEQVYYEIIRQKTATLLSAACEAGATATFEDAAQAARVGLFGEKVGMAFQIKDDLFDYGTSNVGKPVRNDIQERKVTLPLIYTLNNCDAGLKRQLLYIIRHQNTREEKVEYLVEEVKKAGGLQYAEEKMMLYRSEALDILSEFPDSAVQAALKELVYYTTDRQY